MSAGISCPKSPRLHGKQTLATVGLEGNLACRQAVASCSCLSAPVVAVAADAVGGGRWQDTVVQAGETTQEQRVVESPCTEAAGNLPEVASRAKAAACKDLGGAQPVRQ